MLAEYIGVSQLNDFIASRAESDFCVSVEELERLQEVLLADESTDNSELMVRLKFKPGLGASAEGIGALPSVSCFIDGELTLECQRCLEPMQWPARLEFSYGLLLPGSRQSDAADLFEVIELDERGLLVKELVEDELLSAIPMAPKHNDATQCSAQNAAPAEESAEAEEEGETYKPFTGLAELLNKD